MPEMRFTIRWPDGATESCYSPSLVVRDHFAAGKVYRLDDFLARARTALSVASERVQAKYGFPCSRALGQLARIETAAAAFANAADARVQILSFEP
ncbi:MSMEG_0570 family nitrogen starvation response protein [Hansschlegelia zhihuaiae]|uniref:MSMEG_0570 family nitrogen starvation response protein n=1 Tax=Hansschlegelia zhihuaiae TaxID=405005 RepID=A0A4Q0MH78_9HYPH|nr:MSMEG_0570 family nitrogen starvation response protein [Hansschlegelia zhihuaiae]RXF72643.1 MSMEG_0570 family nitrogen starvation response protein [Hansschlegelia zhihuaiae]